jgi:flagellar basal-body rod protein FlgG
MNGALYAVVSGGLAAVERLEITTNNLANTSTAGFKAQYLLVRSVDPNETGGGAGDTTGQLSSTSPTIAYETVTDFSQGSMRESGNPLDVAIAGPGFFVVTTPDGERYTRQGQFHLDPTGTVVNASGYPVQGDEGAEIQLPPGRIEIDTNGTIGVDGVRTAALRLVTFADSAALAPEGATLFAANAEATPVDVDPTDTQVIQGSIELANVDVIRGLVELIDVSRGYEAYMRAIQEVDGTLQTAIQEVAGTA